jgi:hypothetical protein
MNEQEYDNRMVEQLTPKQRVRYIDWLLELAGDNHGGMSEATAAQRCKAFVLTMTKEGTMTWQK